MNSLIPVEQKTVNFNGTELMAVKADDGKIYAGVKWFCQGLFFDKSKSDAQVQKIQADLVLSKGACKINLPTAGGSQETLCIELGFLPLWLAKINANIIDAPEIQERLIDYQLNAKDVLANAFLGNPKSVPKSNDAQILRAEAMHLNAKTNQAKLLKEIAVGFKDKLSEESLRLLVGGVAEILIGKSLFPLQPIEKTYTATEIGAEFGISANKVGKIANANGLKTSEYGMEVLDKSPYSAKHVSAFRYNERGRQKLIELIAGGGKENG
ncbi:MAG: phage antirepressor N-terminal domain-containing protein [Bacillota bacterium]